MIEGYEIVESGGEEIQVVKVFCRICNDYILKSPNEAKLILENWESFVCPNLDCKSNLKPGYLGKMRQDVCGVCLKVFSRTKENPTAQKMCFCPIAERGQIKFVSKEGKTELVEPMIERVESSIEEAKINRILIQRVQEEREKGTPAEQKIIALLEKLTTQTELANTKKELKELES